jgi:ubiquinone/menaquinone biosynthesis C-methylase UbiE
MTVLEFAAGTCWFSRYLSQLQCRTISCDVSSTALEIGKRLFEEFPIIGSPLASPIFLHFDGHKIDLPDESVDRIICNDGFHHVPNQEEVISEFGRVLKRGGIIGFSEPGRFHSQSPQSQYEMRNFNVLENDIFIADIFALAQKYGFTDIRLKVFGDIEVSLNQYKLLTNRITSRLLNIISPKSVSTLLNKTIFFLYKGEYVPDSRSHFGLASTILLEKEVFFVRVGEDLEILVNVSNTGSAKWLIENINDIGVVRIGTHLYDETNRLLELDHSRHDIPFVTESKAAFAQTITLKFDEPGTYKVAIDLVSENVCWFENVGSEPKFVRVHVE